MKTVRFVIALTAVVLIATCRTADDTAANAQPDAATIATMEMTRDYSLGYCNVALNAPDPCVPYRGKTASGIAPGCTHDDCTAAKQNARTNLLAGIPAACGAYIQCNNPCRCIQKTSAGTVQDVRP